MPNTPIDVIFTSTDKRTNSTKLVEGGETIQCFIKDNNSIIEPELLIARRGSPEDFFTWNYFTIPAFNRSYFVTDVVSEDSRQWWIKGDVDLLGTYRDAILDTDAFIMYSQSMYNSMLPDNRIKISDRSETHAVEQPLNWASEDGCYLLTIMSKTATGETGPAQTFAMDKGGLALVAETLNSNNWLQQMLEWVTGDPMDAIISCMWAPFNWDTISHGGSTIEPFGFPLGAGRIADLTHGGMTLIEPYVPYVSSYWNPETGAIEYGWADFRNVEPYTEYYMWLPGAGLVTIPMINIIGYGKDQPRFNVEWTISVPTAEIHYSIRRINDIRSGFTSPSEKVLEVKGSLGVSIPVSSRSGNFVTGLTHAIGAAVSGVLAVETAGTSALASAAYGASAIEMGVSATKNVLQQATNVEGNLGGWLLNDEELTRIVCITRQFITSDSPSQLARTVGRPLFATRRLGDLTGVVKCSGAFVKAQGATMLEQERLSQLLNSSTNFIYGGVIIE